MLATIKAAIAPYLFWIKLIALAAAIGGITYAVVKHDARIEKAADAAGYNRRVAEEATSAAKAQAAANKLDQLGALATQNLHAQLATDLPKIEDTSNARTERIKVIYRDHPVPAGACVRADGVLQQLEDARSAANAAATTATH